MKTRLFCHRRVALSSFFYLLLAIPCGAIECPPSGNYRIQSGGTTSNIWLKWNQDSAVKCEKIDGERVQYNRYDCGGKILSMDFGAIYPKSSLEAYYPTLRIKTKALSVNNCLKQGDSFMVVNKWETHYSVEKTDHQFTIFVETIELRKIKHIKF